MSDPNLTEFYGRVARFERARANGYGFDAEGTLGRSYFLKKAKPRRSWLGVGMMVALCAFGMKAVIFQSVGAAAYNSRVAALQAVGAILVLAMLITPGATAYLLTDRFGTMMRLSAAIGVATSLAGAYASYFINGATGGCIVTLQTLVFLAVFVFEPKRGILASRRAIRMGIQANQPRINANDRE